MFQRGAIEMNLECYKLVATFKFVCLYFSKLL